MRIDLPAPVSPVSTVMPASKSRSRRSTMAKSLMCRWVSMLRFRQAVDGTRLPGGVR